MRFPHLTLFVTRLLRVPTPFPALYRASCIPAVVHPEALHFSETFSLGIQIQQLIWESHISCCYLHRLLRVPTPFWVHFHSFCFMTLLGCIQFPVLSDIPYVFCGWSSSDCCTSRMCHNSLPHFPSSDHPDHIFDLFCCSPLVYLCEFY